MVSRVNTLRVRLPRGLARRLVALVPRLLAGKEPDPTGLVRQLGRRLGLAVLMVVRQAFVEKAAGGTDEAGGKWQPLTASTLKRRPAGQILRDTGLLLNSLSAGDPNNVLDPKAGGVTVGSNLPYAAIHHEGTATIPARPLWPDPAAWPVRWKNEIDRQLAEGVAQLVEELLRRGR